MSIFAWVKIVEIAFQKLSSLTIKERLNAKIEMPVHALNVKDVGKNIKVGFLGKENTETIYGKEIFIQVTLLEKSMSGS